MQYRVAGRNAATDNNNADDCVWNFWNPSSNIVLWITNIRLVSTAAAGHNPQLRRTSTRGTPGSTVTPDIDSDMDNVLAPPSGALLDLGQFSVLPTFGAIKLDRYGLQQQIGAGVIIVFEEVIKVPPGTGFGQSQDTTGALTIQAADISVDWEE